MPLTAIDPVTALIVIDLQKGILAVPTAHPVDVVVRNAADLATAFRAHGLPVVLVTVAGGAPGRTDADQGSSPRPTFSPDFTDLVAELDVQPEDHLVTKQRWGAFTGTSLHDHLASLGVTEVVLTGVATSSGVESTARFAHELGYHVVLATDAMTDRDADAHDHSLQRVLPRLGETARTAEVLDLLTTSRAG